MEHYKPIEQKESEKISKEKGVISPEAEKQIQIEFINTLNKKLAKIDKNIRIDKNSFESIEVNENGEISGDIYNLEANNIERHRLDIKTVLEIIALSLKEKGLKVFVDGEKLFLVQRIKEGYERVSNICQFFLILLPIVTI